MRRNTILIKITDLEVITGSIFLGPRLNFVLSYVKVWYRGSLQKSKMESNATKVND